MGAEPPLRNSADQLTLLKPGGQFRPDAIFPLYNFLPLISSIRGVARGGPGGQSPPSPFQNLADQLTLLKPGGQFRPDAIFLVWNFLPLILSMYTVAVSSL